MNSDINTGIFLGKCVRAAAKTIIVDRENWKATALLCLTSGLRPNAANSSDTYFDSTRCYASYAPVTRVTDAINTGVFPGKMCSDRCKNDVCGQKKKRTAGTSSTIFGVATAARTIVLLNIIKLFLTFVVFA